MVEISKFFGGHKTATVYSNGSNIYTVELVIDGRVIQKQNAYSLGAAEDLAEDFVQRDFDTKTVLLNESSND